MISQLHYITQENEALSHLDCVKQACLNGADWIQLRIKNEPTSKVMELAKEAKDICSDYNTKLIINDYPEIALETNADGIHLGKKDMLPSEARKIIGDKIIGGTANSTEDILFLIEQGIDYIGLGPFRFTSTKENLSPVLGLDGYQTIIETLKRDREDIPPIIAIGGIVLEDIHDLMLTGVHGVAISGTITNDFTQINKINNQIRN